VENGVNLDRYAFDVPTPEGPSAIFIGAMDYLANVDACEYFVREILPLIHKELPQFRFTMGGRNPCRRVQALHNGSTVVVAGSVSDVSGALRSASVSVAPLRVARGIQNKILEAMAVGTPVVASKAAAEGIDAKAGEHFLVEEDQEAFARAVVMLSTDSERAHAMARAARSLVEKRYRWEDKLERLEKLLSETAALGRK
jgi:glycosyltransferase involved in cell wall biosynthesis